MVRKASNTGPKRHVKHIPSKKQYFTEEQMAQALKDNRGLIYATADALNISGQTVGAYLKRYPKLRLVIKQAKKAGFQRVVRKTLELAEAGNEKCIRYVLFGSPEGKEAGWSFGKVITHKGDASLGQRVEVQQITPDKAREILEKAIRNTQLRQQQNQPAQTEPTQPLQIGLKEMPIDTKEIIDVEIVEVSQPPLSPPDAIDCSCL